MRAQRNTLWLFIALLLLAGAATARAAERVGWVERVRLYPGGITVKAKLDTGAKTSSINCDCITPIKRNGEEWVRFRVTNDQGKSVAIERRVVRHVKIKRHFGEVQRRMVIKLGLCLKGVYKETEVSLIDRTGFNYPLLIGRQFLAGDFMIDPDATFTSKPRCPQAPDGK